MDRYTRRGCKKRRKVEREKKEVTPGDSAGGQRMEAGTAENEIPFSQPARRGPFFNVKEGSPHLRHDIGIGLA